MAEQRFVDWDGLVYYDGKVKHYIEDKLENCLKMGGKVTFEELPSPSFENLNYIYKVTEEFTSNNYFEKPGYIYNAGTWVQVADLNNIYLYIIFSETDITPVGPGGIDLDNYYTKTEIDTLINALRIDLQDYAKKSDIPNIEGLATEQFVLVQTNQVTEQVTNVTQQVEQINENLTQNYVTIDQAITKENLNTEVQPLIEKEVQVVIETEVETLVEEKVNEIASDGITVDGINYDTW